MFVCFSHYPNVLRYAINGFSLSWVWISHGGDWWVMFLAFISTQKLFIVFSPLSYGGNERVAGWVFCPWPRLNHPRTGCSVGQIVILVLLSCPELQDICAEGWQGQYGDPWVTCALWDSSLKSGVPGSPSKNTGHQPVATWSSLMSLRLGSGLTTANHVSCPLLKKKAVDTRLSQWL